MVWFYERGSEILRIGTRFDNATSSYELIWYRADGTQSSEQYATEAAFRGRLEAVEAALANERWTRSGVPEFQPDGWRRDPV